MGHSGIADDVHPHDYFHYPIVVFNILNCVEYSYHVYFQGEVLFNSWQEIFSGTGGEFSQKPRIFSFNGKEILSSRDW